MQPSLSRHKGLLSPKRPLVLHDIWLRFSKQVKIAGPNFETIILATLLISRFRRLLPLRITSCLRGKVEKISQNASEIYGSVRFSPINAGYR
jgi:hypothetical protein